MHGRTRRVIFAAAIVGVAAAVTQQTSLVGGQMATADRVESNGWWPTQSSAQRCDYVGTGASSFMSQRDQRVHFGLAGDVAYDRIEVQWPGGRCETFRGGKGNRIVRLTQGTGTAPK